MKAHTRETPTGSSSESSKIKQTPVNTMTPAPFCDTFQCCIAGRHRRTSETSAMSRWRLAKMWLAYRWAPIREPVRKAWATEDLDRSCKVTEPPVERALTAEPLAWSNSISRSSHATILTPTSERWSETFCLQRAALASVPQTSLAPLLTKTSGAFYDLLHPSVLPKLNNCHRALIYMLALVINAGFNYALSSDQ